MTTTSASGEKPPRSGRDPSKRNQKQRQKASGSTALPNSAAAIQRAAEGALRGIARRNQLLPWAWDDLTPLDLTEIAELLWDLPESATDVQKEASFAIAAILTTGRKLSSLERLSIFETENGLAHAAALEGLIRNSGKPYWRLTAGSPGRQYARRPRKDGRQRYKNEIPANILFVLSPIALHCLKRLPAYQMVGTRPLLQFSSDKLKSTIERMLYNRRQDVEPPRRCSRTLESLERFLTVAITHQSGGDIGPAARFTDSDEVMSRSVMHYGVSHLSSTIRRAREATSILNRDLPSYFVKGVSAGKVGNVRTPSWPDVKELIHCCGTFLENEQHDVERTHLAMTFYTVALLSYALGHRGMGELLPGTAAVDATTGFCRIHEKLKKDPVESRVVWVAPVAVKQMAAYEEHLFSLRTRLHAPDFATVEAQVKSGRLPLFVLRGQTATRQSLRMTWKRLNQIVPLLSGNFKFHDNSGRHWLRSELEGQCSTETLHAFFGHWQSGTEPWSLGSCFDPLLYRADLEARLAGVLTRVGWTARSANGAAL